MSNLNDPQYAAESRVPQILAGSLIPFAVASVTIIARFVTRGFITCNWGPDDSWVVVAWVFDIVLTTLNCLLTRYGIGRHQYTVPTDHHRTALLIGYYVRLVYQLVLGSTKIAICTLFLRIFGSYRRDRYVIYGLLAFIGCYSTAMIFASIFQCHPISNYWENANSSTCTNYLITLWITGICNILADSFLMALVVPRILSLHVPPRQKAALLVVVSLGSLSIVAAIVRLARVTQFNSTSDESWNASDITTWSAVESSVGLFCACAPPLKPLYRVLRGHVPSSYNTGSSSNVYNRRTANCGCYITSEGRPNDHQHDNLDVGVSITQEFGTDVASTKGLVRSELASQSYPMTVTAVVTEQALRNSTET